MHSFLRSGPDGLEPVDGAGPGIWTHISDPTDEECAELQNRLDLPADWIRDSLDPYQRARFQRLDDLALLIVLSPRTVRNRPEPFATVPVGLVLAADRVVTITHRDPDMIGDLRTGPQPRTDDPAAFAVAVLSANEEVFRRELREIHDRSTFEEEELKRSLTGERLAELIDHGRSLAYFSSALESNGRMLASFRDEGLEQADPETRAAFDEVIERNGENTEIAAVFSRIHNDLMEGFSSLVSMNLNVLVRTLTEITIALALPALVVGLWGMNVAVPFEEVDIAFAVLLGLMVVVAIATFFAIRFGERIRLGFSGRS